MLRVLCIELMMVWLVRWKVLMLKEGMFMMDFRDFVESWWVWDRVKCGCFIFVD